MFWPDKASAHCSKQAVEFFKAQNFTFNEHDNPLNLPERRCIENFWSCLKGDVYKDGWEAENLDQLRNRIKYCLGQFEPDLVHRLTRRTNTQINAVRRLDVLKKDCY